MVVQSLQWYEHTTNRDRISRGLCFLLPFYRVITISFTFHFRFDTTNTLWYYSNCSEGANPRATFSPYIFHIYNFIFISFFYLSIHYSFRFALQPSRALLSFKAIVCRRTWPRAYKQVLYVLGWGPRCTRNSYSPVVLRFSADYFLKTKFSLSSRVFYLWCETNTSSCRRHSA